MTSWVIVAVAAVALGVVAVCARLRGVMEHPERALSE